MSDTSAVEVVLRSMTDTVLANETYFSDLDSVVGDGDFGYSLARGFEKVDEAWPELDRSDPGTFLQKIAMIVSSRVGGTSGPIWGTALLRAAMTIKKADALDGTTAVAALRAAIEGIQKRGGAELGDKTLLDALIPMTDTVEQLVASGAHAPRVLHEAATTARSAAESTAQLQAKRGRASYTGERSVGSPDPGAVAIAVIAEDLAKNWK